jgi:hypothetical protein
VSSQETAQKIIDQLKAGGDFATLAKRSRATSPRPQKGGDLGWFPPDAMGNKNFADAVGLLEEQRDHVLARSRRSTAGTCCSCWARATVRRRASRACRTS